MGRAIGEICQIELRNGRLSGVIATKLEKNVKNNRSELTLNLSTQPPTLFY